MFLKCKQRSLIAIMLVSSGLTSCGISKKNDTKINREDVLLAPSASVSVKSPDGIVYAQSSFAKGSRNLGDVAEGLHTAIGDGGLGADLDSKNALIPFKGIPISSSFSHIDEDSKAVFIIPTGDPECPDLFSLNSDNTRINIDKSKINHLIVCNVKVEVSAYSQKTGTSVSDEKIVAVVLNPTLAMYAAKNDPVFRFLQYYSSLKDINLIAKWLKDPSYQAAGLNLKYDKKVIKDLVRLVDLNALTGAQNIAGINVADNATLHDVRGLLYLQNLQSVNVSNTKIESKDVSSLKDIANLKSLDVSNTDLKNLKAVTDNLKNLEVLNISGNKNIEDLEDIQNLKNLRVLNASNIGISNLEKLDGLTQITELDISKNDLSSLSVDKAQSLVNLFNLSSLNVSETHIKDEVLNSYFDAVSNRNTLTKFVDANHFDRAADVTEDVCKSQVNIVDSLYNLMKVTSLQYIDFHGNGCNINDGFKQIGLTTTGLFSSMPNLTYLDISDTPVKDLSGIAHAKNLKELHVFHHPVPDDRKFIDEGGISMTANACISYLGKHNPLASECDDLGDGQEEFQEFIQAGKYDFKVPENVFKIHILGCSAGDGGQGGQGFEGTNTVMISSGGDGPCGDHEHYPPGAHCKYPPTYANVPAGVGTIGNIGEIGNITQIEDMFSTTQEPVYAAYNGHCAGGSGGSGAIAGKNGENKKLLESDLNVKPDQILKITIPGGGLPGTGGAGTGGGCTDGRCGSRASNGSPGNPGSDGYLKIIWSK